MTGGFVSARVYAASGYAVATSDPLATRTAERILASGGTAADAAVAAALVLAVVDPARSGIGGGGMAVYFDKARNQTAAFDYLESIPLTVVEGFLPVAADGTNATAANGAVLPGVPGMVAGLEKLEARFGKLGWKAVFADAISLAREGFVPEERYRNDLALAPPSFAGDTDFKTFFIDAALGKKPLLKQANLAATLEKIRDGGSDNFYRGALAQILLAELAARKSAITYNDWAYYEARVVEPTSYYFKDVKIIAPGLPSYGVTLLDFLQRTARVDGAIADTPGFAGFLEKRTTQFLAENPFLQDVAPIKSGYASTIAIVDAAGNAVAMTNTLHGLFGSGVTLNGSGILLNAAGKDGSVYQKLADKSVNLDGALKQRPVSYLLPLVGLKAFEETIALAPSGGMAAPQALFKILQKTYVAGDDLGAAIKSPRLIFLPQEKTGLFEKKFPSKALKDKTHTPFSLSPYPLAEVNAVQIVKGKARAIMDPRR